VDLSPYYDEGGITIYHGNADDVMPLLSDGVSLVVTDPPYFQPAAHYVNPRGEVPERSVGDLSILEGVFKRWCAEMARLAQGGQAIYFFCDGQSYPLAFTALFRYARRVRPLVWDKLTSFNGYTWRHQHELIAWAELPEAERVPTGDGDILKERAVPVGERLPPAQKPIALVGRLIDKHPSGLVLDPFCGSGSTLIAAREVGRRAVGIEIEERYCEIAATRLAQGVLV
jgi:site-specific DNA-methyltransferase (adenine-specific)